MLIIHTFKYLHVKAIQENSLFQPTLSPTYLDFLRRRATVMSFVRLWEQFYEYPIKCFL